MEITDADPFDLPDWLGVDEVTWQADAGLRTGYRVAGRLSGHTEDDRHDDLACDLLAVDEAYPEPVLDSAGRARAHQAWQHGQVLLGQYDERLTLAVPGTGFAADRALDAVARLARAVGADPARWTVLLRIGEEVRGRDPRGR